MWLSGQAIDLKFLFESVGSNSTIYETFLIPFPISRRFCWAAKEIRLFRKIGQGPIIPGFPVRVSNLVFAPSSGPENGFIGRRYKQTSQRKVQGFREIADGSTDPSPADNEPDNEHKIEPHAGIFYFYAMSSNRFN